ncbi:phospholipid carrier-dependent glycosyltransferase [bacterium]|nr:MAG: phospholipid carrier-dependent glycosyltransferase [bacterium]
MHGDDRDRGGHRPSAHATPAAHGLSLVVLSSPCVRGHRVGRSTDRQVRRPGRTLSLVGRGGCAGGVHPVVVSSGGQTLNVSIATPESQARFAPWASSWRSVLFLVGLVSLARVVYLAWVCPYTLVEDEAHYWEWSRHLDWSYYSKGPGVAWVIAASTRLLGDHEYAVRLPAVVCSSIAAISLAGLAREASGEKRAGFFAAACFQLVPMFFSTSMLMTIDMPYAACWSVAAWAAWRAFDRDALGAWVLLGFSLAAGIVFKYTMLLLLPGLILFVIIRRRDIRVRPAGPIVAFVLAALGVVPILIWNAARGWPTFHHLLGHLGVSGGDVAPTQGVGGYHYDPEWTLEYVGTQLALVGPMMGLAWIGFQGLRRTSQVRPATFLACCAAPIILFYLAVSFIAEPEGNWALAGYTTLTALAGVGVVRPMDDWSSRMAAWRALPKPRPRVGLILMRPESAGQVLWHATLVVGLVFVFASLRLDLVARLPLIGSRIPLSHFMGADQMAAHTQRLLVQLREQSPGKEPFVMSQFYGRASQMAFYLPDHPTVYCSGSLMGGRKTQYDLWDQTSLGLPSLAGRPAILLGDADQSWRWPGGSGFSRVERVGKLEGDRKRNRVASFGFDYHPVSP